MRGNDTTPPPRTCRLYGRNDQVVREDLAKLGSPGCLACKCLLELGNEDMAEGCRDEETVKGHFDGLDVDVGGGEGANEWGCIFGRAHRDTREVAADDFLQEGERPCQEKPALRSTRASKQFRSAPVVKHLVLRGCRASCVK